MKISNIEKAVIGIICFLMLIMITGVVSFVTMINEAGGIKNVLIEAGKEINNISTEIAK